MSSTAIDPAEIIQALHAEGKSLRAIAAALNERGIPAPAGGEWHATQISRVLDRSGLAEPATDEEPSTVTLPGDGVAAAASTAPPAGPGSIAEQPAPQDATPSGDGIGGAEPATDAENGTPPGDWQLDDLGLGQWNPPVAFTPRAGGGTLVALRLRCGRNGSDVSNRVDERLTAELRRRLAEQIGDSEAVQRLDRVKPQYAAAKHKADLANAQIVAARARRQFLTIKAPENLAEKLAEVDAETAQAERELAAAREHTSLLASVLASARAEAKQNLEAALPEHVEELRRRSLVCQAEAVAALVAVRSRECSTALNALAEADAAVFRLHSSADSLSPGLAGVLDGLGSRVAEPTAAPAVEEAQQ